MTVDMFNSYGSMGSLFLGLPSSKNGKDDVQYGLMFCDHVNEASVNVPAESKNLQTTGEDVIWRLVLFTLSCIT